MSRPGFVFDLVTTDPQHTIEERCRSCGWKEQAGTAQTAELNERMRLHLKKDHALAEAAEWKVTHQQRSPQESVVCFWPPEAL